MNVRFRGYNRHPIDALTPSCFDTRKARIIKRRWLSAGGVACVGVNGSFLSSSVT